MNRLSKIFLVIIIILVIALGVMTYYYIQLRNLYFDTADLLIEIQNQQIENDNLDNNSLQSEDTSTDGNTVSEKKKKRVLKK